MSSNKRWNNNPSDRRSSRPMASHSRRQFNNRFQTSSTSESQPNWNSNVKKFSQMKKKTKNNDRDADRDAPQEMSSKIKSHRVRPVFEVTANKTAVRRDPRFEENCGRFSESVFEQTYSFVKDIKSKELEQLKRMLKKAKSAERIQELTYLLERMKNQMASEQIKEKKKELEKKTRKTLSDETGTKSFVNKSTLKRVELVDRFMQLKKSGKLKQYLEKKRKKNAIKDKKKLFE